MRRGVRWTPTYARDGADIPVRRPPHRDRSTGWEPRIAVLRRPSYNEAVAGAAPRQSTRKRAYRIVGGVVDGMTRRTWLNDLLERFQHRWETNSQYRAAMSGVLGLIFLLVICSCVGALTASTGSVLGALGFGGANNGQAQAHSGGSGVKGVATFPIATVNLPSPNTIPDDPTLTTSGTPLPTATTAPTPTDTPTATPCTSNCGGGGGGGCTSCTVTDSGVPNPFVHGQNGTIIVHTSKPNIGINIIAHLPGCNLLNNGTGVTDGAGNYSWSFAVCPGTGYTNIVVEAGFPSGLVYGPTIVQQVI